MAVPRKRLTWLYFALLAIIILPAAVTAKATAFGAESTGQTGDVQTGQLTESWFSIQVGAFSQLSTAENYVASLSDKGCTPFYRYTDTGSKGMWYRVFVDKYTTRKAARQAAEQLVQQRIVDTYLLRKVLAQPDTHYAATVQDATLLSIDFQSEDNHPAASLPESNHSTMDSPMAQTGSLAIRSDTSGQVASDSQSSGTDDPQAESTAVRLTLMDAMRYSLEGNREIDVVAYDPKQAQAQLENTQSVYDPLLFADSTFRRDPNLESSNTDIVTDDDQRMRAGVRKPLKTGGTISTYLETRYSDQNNAVFPRTYKNIVAPTVELQQPLLNNIGSKKEQTAIKIASYRTSISSAEFRQKVIQVTNSVGTVYWKLYMFKELIDINRANLDMAEEVYRRESERFARGISQQLDVARARSNAQVRRSTLLRSQEEYRLAMDRLKLLLNWGELNIDSTTEVLPVEMPRTKSINVEEHAAIEKALGNRPEIVKAQQELMIREVDEKLAAHQRLPKLDAYGRYSVSGYGHDVDGAWNDVSMNDEDAWEVGIEFEWAIGNRPAKSQYRRKVLGRKQADAQLKRITDDIKLEVKQILHRMATVMGEIEANQAAKAAAEKVVEGEFTRFDIGQTSNEELLRAQDLLAMTSRSVARSIADYNTTIVDLARVQGVLPDGISMDTAIR